MTVIAKQKWLKICSKYNINFRFIESKRNIVADYLSRNFTDVTNTINKIKNNEANNNVISYEYLSQVHIENGLPGVTKMYNTFMRYYSSELLQKRIKEIVINCNMRQLIKTSSYQYGIPSGNISTKDELKHLSTDVYGPLMQSFINIIIRKTNYYSYFYRQVFEIYSTLYYKKHHIKRNY